MRTILKKYLGFYFWKEVTEEFANKQIMQLEMDLKSEDDCMAYLNKIARTEIDITKPRWEFRHVENYTKDKSVVFFRMHHGWCDGVGFVSLMSALTDNQFTTKLTKQIIKLSLIEKIWIGITTPFTLAKVTPEMNSWKTDINSQKMREYTADDHQTNTLYIK